MGDPKRKPAADGEPWKPPPRAHDPHYERQGETAWDDDGVGEGEEGYQAEDYPGHNPLRNETPEAREGREREAWSAPHRLEPDPRPRLADERIRADVLERLARIEPDGAGVAVRVEGGTVTLDGRVADEDARRTLEHACGTVPGVRAIASRITID